MQLNVVCFRDRQWHNITDSKTTNLDPRAHVTFDNTNMLIDLLVITHVLMVKSY